MCCQTARRKNKSLNKTEVSNICQTKLHELRSAKAAKLPETPVLNTSSSGCFAQQPGVNFIIKQKWAQQHLPNQATRIEVSNICQTKLHELRSAKAAKLPETPVLNTLSSGCVAKQPGVNLIIKQKRSQQHLPNQATRIEVSKICQTKLHELRSAKAAKLPETPVLNTSSSGCFAKQPGVNSIIKQKRAQQHLPNQATRIEVSKICQTKLHELMSAKSAKLPKTSVFNTSSSGCFAKMPGVNVMTKQNWGQQNLPNQATRIEVSKICQTAGNVCFNKSSSGCLGKPQRPQHRATRIYGARQD
jgi:hypothetical protein